MIENPLFWRKRLKRYINQIKQHKTLPNEISSIAGEKVYLFRIL